MVAPSSKESCQTDTISHKLTESHLGTFCRGLIYENFISHFEEFSHLLFEWAVYRPLLKMQPSKAIKALTGGHLQSWRLSSWKRRSLGLSCLGELLRQLTGTGWSKGLRNLGIKGIQRWQREILLAALKEVFATCSTTQKRKGGPIPDCAWLGWGNCWPWLRILSGGKRNT